MVRARKQRQRLWSWWRQLQFSRRSSSAKKDTKEAELSRQNTLIDDSTAGKNKQLETGTSKESEKIQALDKEEVFRIIKTFENFERAQKEQLKSASEFQRVLLEPQNAARIKKENLLREIVVDENQKDGHPDLPAFKALFEKFDQGVADWEEKRDFCFYQLFILFAKLAAKPTVTEQEKQIYLHVLEWLATEKQIEKVFQRQGKSESTSIINYLALSNNWVGLQWCFNWYRKETGGQKNKQLFVNDDLFEFVATGVVKMEKENRYPDERVLSEVLEEFERVTEGQLKEGVVEAKKRLLEELILEETEMPVTLINFFKEDGEPFSLRM